MLCVGLMVTCVNDAMFPEVGRAVVSLLRRLDVDVDFPMSQTCCAQPMVNTGYLDLAVPVVRTFVSAFADYDAIVTPSGSCAGSARHQHGVVARRSGDPSLVAAVERTGPRVHELSEFLVDVLGVRVGRSRSTSATCVMSTPRTPSGLHRARTEDQPALEPMLNDLRARRFRYNERDVDAIVDELAANVAGFRDEVARVRPDQWELVVTRLPGEQRTARWLVRQAMHEGQHHLNDIRTTGEAVIART